MLGRRRRGGRPLNGDGFIAAELLVVEPQLEAYVCRADDDVDRVFDAQVVPFERPEVGVFGDEFLFVGSGEVGGDFAEEAGVWGWC